MCVVAFLSVAAFTSTATVGATCPSGSVSLSSPPLTTMWSTTPACHIAQQTCPTGYIGKSVYLLYVCKYMIYDIDYRLFTEHRGVLTIHIPSVMCTFK